MKGSSRKNCKGTGLAERLDDRHASMKGSSRKNCKLTPVQALRGGPGGSLNEGQFPKELQEGRERNALTCTNGTSREGCAPDVNSTFRPGSRRRFWHGGYDVRPARTSCARTQRPGRAGEALAGLEHDRTVRRDLRRVT